ncbi:type II toxin-antitoxin system RelE family toxin [Weissella kandleri]|uniref:type II toxin-antitoxin system RelE family toxin n=1 Tax=Weissella kandleri TaxID=1616 RepID=UPI0007101390|nr:type II toxin-antitoxin system RelE/ParE family toxin [Weissella kandleri]
MKYSVNFDKKALKEFRKLDKPVQKRIVTWLEQHISGSENPRLLGKALEGNFNTLWRYRVGNYRIIADIKDDEFIVLIVKTGKRNDVYKSR